MAGVGASKEMTADGTSDSWENNKANQVRLGNAFLKHISITDSALAKKWGADWGTVPEEHACSQEIYGHFATFLTQVYKKASDKHMELGGVITAWGGVVYQASQRFKASTRPETKVGSPTCAPTCACALSSALLRADTLRALLLVCLQEFFECLRGDNCPQVHWYRGIKQKITRLVFERKMFMDEPMDNSANEI